MNSRKVQKTGIVARWGNTDGNNPPYAIQEETRRRNSLSLRGRKGQEAYI